MERLAATVVDDHEDISPSGPQKIAHLPHRSSIGCHGGEAHEVGPEMRARRRSTRLGAWDAQQPAIQRGSRVTRRVAGEANDARRRIAAHALDGERAYAVALEHDAVAEAIGNVAERLDPDLAANTVRAMDLADDERG